MIIIGIAGGSGSGKTTVSQALATSDPDRFEILSLDNYQKPADDPTMPKVDGMINWDHPSVMNWDNLRHDVLALKAGNEVHTTAWKYRSVAGIKEKRTLLPKPVIIVEGYLALYPEVANLYDRKIYLDLGENARYARRRQARGSNDTESVEDIYHTSILKPMHDLYVEPTKDNADLVINVEDKSVDDLVRLILRVL